MTTRIYLGWLCWLILLAGITRAEEPLPAAVEASLERAGKNRAELLKAWQQAPAAQKPGLQFLLENMPPRDLQSLSGDFLLQNLELAYEVRQDFAWSRAIPDDMFLNNVLPYVAINERRDAWRKEFRDRFRPLVKEANSPSQAAAILNRKIFEQLNVRYSKNRRKADQSPFESMETGTASCTGLSVLLVDACRAVGVPARLVGTPLWANKSGNHTWVEVWDQGWHFTGAAEPTDNVLDKGWFTGRAAEAQADHPEHAIYAVSFKRTPQHFPMVWAPRNAEVFAVNVTARYLTRQKLPEGSVEVLLQVLDRRGGSRQAAALTIEDKDRRVVFQGTSHDERFDGNDHLPAILAEGETYRVRVKRGDVRRERSFRATSGALLTLYLE